MYSAGPVFTLFLSMIKRNIAFSCYLKFSQQVKHYISMKIKPESLILTPQHQNIHIIYIKCSWPVLTELKLDYDDNNNNNIWILCLICLTSLPPQKRDLNPLSWIYHFLRPLRTGLASSVLTKPGRYSGPTVTLNVSIHTAFQSRQDNIHVWHFYHCHKLSFQPCFFFKIACAGYMGSKDQLTKGFGINAARRSCHLKIK